MTPNEDTPEQLEEKPLCLSCMFPNDPSAHFCSKCGAPLTSYASTGPFESLFAEGNVYRQAVERPRSLIVVFGIWLIFGPMALGAVVLLFIGQNLGIHYILACALLLPISLVMIWKTTRGYLKRPRSDEKPEA